MFDLGPRALEPVLLGCQPPKCIRAAKNVALITISVNINLYTTKTMTQYVLIIDQQEKGVYSHPAVSHTFLLVRDRQMKHIHLAIVWPINCAK